MSLATVAVNALNGVAYATLLLTVGAGLTVIFGAMDVLNLAHGTLFLGGAYLAATLAGPSWASWMLAGLAGLAAGIGAGLLLAGLLRPLRQFGHVQQALLTLGLAFIADWAFTTLFGASPLSAALPPQLAGSITVLGYGYPTYRLWLVVVAVPLAAGLHYLLRRSHPGRLLRATIDDAGMAAVSGVRTGQVRVVALAAGSALAVLGGVLGAPLYGAAPGVDTQILTQSLIVVVLGGAGSLPRTAGAALTVGLVQAFTADSAAIAPFLLFVIVLAVLVVRGRAETVRIA